MPDTQQMLAQAKQLLKTDKKKAREILLQIVDIDERNEDAWLYMSGAVDSVDEQIVALENVLALNPNHKIARKGLDAIQQKKGKASAAPPPAPKPAARPTPKTDDGWGSFGSNDSFGFGSTESADSGFGDSSTWGGFDSTPPAPVASSSGFDDWAGGFASAPAAASSPDTSAGDVSDPWGSIADPWSSAPATPAAAATQFTNDPFDPWGNSAASAPVDENPWGGSTPAASASSSISYGFEESDPFANDDSSMSFDFGEKPPKTAAKKSAVPPSAPPTQAQSPIFQLEDTGFTFDEADGGGGFDFSFGGGKASDLDDVFGNVSDDSHRPFIDPFVEDKPRKKSKSAKDSRFYSDIPTELKIPTVPAGRGMVIAVGVLGLFNVLALVGLLLAL